MVRSSLSLKNGQQGSFSELRGFPEDMPTAAVSQLRVVWQSPGSGQGEPSASLWLLCLFYQD